MKSEERVPHQFDNPLEELDMNVFRVYAVIERIDYAGEYIRGIYLTKEESEARRVGLSHSKYVSDDVEYGVREITVGEDVNPY